MCVNDCKVKHFGVEELYKFRPFTIFYLWVIRIHTFRKRQIIFESFFFLNKVFIRYYYFYFCCFQSLGCRRKRKGRGWNGFLHEMVGLQFLNIIATFLWSPGEEVRLPYLCSVLFLNLHPASHKGFVKLLKVNIQMFFLEFSCYVFFR